MPGRKMAYFNRHVTNHISIRLAPRMNAFGIVNHVGRSSGKHFRTPVNVFDAPDGYIFALTFGPDAHWVKNVVAAGGCELEHRRKKIQLVEPKVYKDPERRHIRPFWRSQLKMMGIDNFLSMKLADRPAPGQSGASEDAAPVGDTRQEEAST